MARKYDDFEDDGHTIASMDVDGMPWSVVRRHRPEKKLPARDKMSRRESLAAIGGALKAGLLVGLAYILGFGVFIALCVFVFFK